jgi:hypothetical protein
MQLTPDAQKTGLGILGIQGCSLSTNWHWSAIKAFARVGAESAGMREKLLEAPGLIASTVQRQTHNILETITSVENSTYLPIIISSEEVEITESYHNFFGLTRIGDTMALSMTWADAS